MDRDSAIRKKEQLIRQLGGTDSLLVAYSGGVDSSFLLAVAHEVLGSGVLAATASSEIYSAHERDASVRFTRERGIEQIIFELDAMSVPAVISNGPDRCYHCKRRLFQRLVQIAEERGISRIAHGANTDDLVDYRPGFKAAQEMGIKAPLLDAGLNKEDIRYLSKEMGLPSWDKPAMACLATRIPYGEPITSRKLHMIDEAETFLLKKGLRQCRVRHHGPLARIEVEGPDLVMITDDNFRGAVLKRFKEIGFLYVALDLEGYASGSMNRVLTAS